MLTPLEARNQKPGGVSVHKKQKRRRECNTCPIVLKQRQVSRKTHTRTINRVAVNERLHDLEAISPPTVNFERSGEIKDLRFLF